MLQSLSRASVRFVISGQGHKEAPRASIMNSTLCVPEDWRAIMPVPVSAWHSQLWLLIQRYGWGSLSLQSTQLLRTNNSRAVSKQSKGSCLLISTIIRKPGWDSRIRGALKSPLLGLYHPLPGLCAPSTWLNRPTDSAVPTSTSATWRGV